MEICGCGFPMRLERETKTFRCTNAKCGAFSAALTREEAAEEERLATERRALEPPAPPSPWEQRDTMAPPWHPKRLR